MDICILFIVHIGSVSKICVRIMKEKHRCEHGNYRQKEELHQANRQITCY